LWRGPSPGPAPGISTRKHEPRASSTRPGRANNVRATEHALAAARAQLAEAAEQHLDAAALYADAAERWHEFGNVPERAYALLGQGRCLSVAGDAGAEPHLHEARELFASMGFAPAVAEVDRYLGSAEAAAL
jgi:hypothetical protein